MIDQISNIMRYLNERIEDHGKISEEFPESEYVRGRLAAYQDILEIMEQILK